MTFTPVLHRYRGKHPLYFGAKWDDFWWVERFWAILCNEVYREPRPKTIKKVMRRVREASLNVSEKTLIRLVHQSPARMHEIFKQKGGRIPARWNYKKSPYACTCKICTEWNFHNYMCLKKWQFLNKIKRGTPLKILKKSLFFWHRILQLKLNVI